MNGGWQMSFITIVWYFISFAMLMRSSLVQLLTDTALIFSVSQVPFNANKAL